MASSRRRNSMTSLMSSAIFSRVSKLEEDLFNVSWKSYATLGFVTVMPLMIVAVLSGSAIVQISELSQQATQLTSLLRLTVSIGDLVYSLQRERGISCLYIDSQLSSRSTVFQTVARFRNQSSSLLSALYIADKEHTTDLCMSDMLLVFQHRQQVTDDPEITCPINLKYYTDRIRCLTSVTFKLYESVLEGYYRWNTHAPVLASLANYYEKTEAIVALNFISDGGNLSTTQGQLILSSSLANELHESTKWTAKAQDVLAAKLTIDWFGINRKIREDSLLTPEMVDPSSVIAFHCELSTKRADLNEKRSAAFEEELFGYRTKKSVIFWIFVIVLGSTAIACALMSIIYGAFTYRTMAKVQEMTKNVAEQGDEVAAVKKRADQLLYGMLPKAVAIAMKNKQPIVPTTFESATVVFMQIKNFADLTKNASPIEAVNIVGIVYNRIDAIINNYDCYKVETVGDQYMLCSGIPTKNGNEHSKEIALMVLDVIADLRFFHLSSSDSVKISAGMNTGSVVGGVIGIRAPRYCLFGNTINVASRMNSNSKEYHCLATTNCAQHIKTYHSDKVLLKDRGEIQVKGKGTMSVAWVVASSQKALKRSDSQTSIC